ncbi:tail fiber protein [Salmonella phage SS8]|nr:tail fibers protein [Salmonella phage SF4]QDH44812.1 tail fiber protein [Salmonella phage SF5]QDH44854.1 tail fibers protein [Salmonella phage SS4]QDH44961.1 tail fiber protein [Salmonella phage SS10]QDH45028.1 tail fiber protein [Salmonella phage SI2]QDH45048.1 tail fibers protein [Salmonella phage SF1]QEI24448.1 tail fiber protein [Salmonella phage SS6]QEI24555.1 tail fiber protein [Salmonella phage SS7]QEI24777.1 tail fiber protein [Salmonella phage SF2]QEI24829.1 tail fiber protein 
MSSGCGDTLSLNDLQIAKKHQIFEAEVITGKQGGVAGGADIDYATNQVTGQTQKTLPAVLRSAGFSPASFNFTTGGTLGVNDANKAVLWPKEDGGDGNYYAWRGSLPKVIPAASTPLTTGGISDSAWVAFGDITFRAEADKKFKYSVKLSDFTTLQQLADAAVDSVLIDRDYTFSNNETVNFGGKTLTIDCKAKFIGDGALIFTNMGSGSIIEKPFMESATTPWVIKPWTDDNQWITDPAAVVATLKQSKTDGYQPTVNDYAKFPGIESLLPPEAKDQNISSVLEIRECTGVEVHRASGLMACFLFRGCHFCKMVDADNPSGGKDGVITFENLSGDWGKGNYVIGGRTSYGSVSSAQFLRNNGGFERDGGVIGFTSYRAGESGVKTWQGTVGSTTSRNYNLQFRDSVVLYPVWDGFDLGADTDMNPEADRPGDYPVSQYPVHMLPLNHLIDNLLVRGCLGVGFGMDGQGLYVSNITVEDCAGSGAYLLTHETVFTNIAVIDTNTKDFPANQIYISGACRVNGLRLIGIRSTAGQGLTIDAPNSTVSGITGFVDPSRINVANLMEEGLGNTRINSFNNDSAALRLRIHKLTKTLDSGSVYSHINGGPGSGSAWTEITAISGSLPDAVSLKINRGDYRAMEIPVAVTVLPDAAVRDNGSISLYLEGDSLKALVKRADGSYTRLTLA